MDPHKLDLESAAVPEEVLRQVGERFLEIAPKSTDDSVRMLLYLMASGYCVALRRKKRERSFEACVIRGRQET